MCTLLREFPWSCCVAAVATSAGMTGWVIQCDLQAYCVANIVTMLLYALYSLVTAGTYAGVLLFAQWMVKLVLLWLTDIIALFVSVFCIAKLYTKSIVTYVSHVWIKIKK